MERLHSTKANANCQKPGGQMRSSSPGREGRVMLKFPVGSQIKVGEG